MDRELLVKYIDGIASNEETEIVICWLDENVDHMKEYATLRKLQDIIIWNEEILKVKKLSANKNKNFQKNKRIWLEVFKVASILLVAFFASRFFVPQTETKDLVVLQTLFVPAGQRAELSLADGTKVYLNAKTTFIFPNQFSNNERKVQLYGEAYFKVTTNKSRPFIVQTHNYDVKVWGTEFNLMAYADKGIFDVELLEGSVEVLHKNQSDGLFIKPNERIFEEYNQLKIDTIKHYNHFLWREGIISFENDTFLEIANMLQLYFDVSIDIKSKNILNYHCTGKFRMKDGVEHILKVLQLKYFFKYDYNDTKNVITIE